MFSQTKALTKHLGFVIIAEYLGVAQLGEFLRALSGTDTASKNEWQRLGDWQVSNEYRFPENTCIFREKRTQSEP